MPNPEQNMPSSPDATHERTDPQLNPHDQHPSQTDADAELINDSAGAKREPGGKDIPAEPMGVRSEDSTKVETEAMAATSSKREAQAQSSPQESNPETAGPTVDEGNAAVLSDSRRHTRRSFAVAAAAAVAGYGLYHWLDHLPAEEMQPSGYRKAFETNAAISWAIFDDRALAPTYALSKAENLRVNGVYGLKMMLAPASYRLQMVGSDAPTSHPQYSRDVTSWEYAYVDEKAMEDQGHDTKTPPPSAKTSEKMSPRSMLEQEIQRENRSGRMPRGKEEAGESRSTLAAGTPGLLLTMEDILRFPRHELVTQFKCIEGWSQIVHWAGIRMADFLDAYPPALIDGKQPKYVYMETPDGDYYTGYDLHVCRHPQTLLVTEMMGQPLTQYHGAPLRLHMPIKYGYKQIKRIGLISYTNSKPDDYWTKLGYDWYAGL